MHKQGSKTIMFYIAILNDILLSVIHESIQVNLELLVLFIDIYRIQNRQIFLKKKKQFFHLVIFMVRLSVIHTDVRSTVTDIFFFLFLVAVSFYLFLFIFYKLRYTHPFSKYTSFKLFNFKHFIYNYTCQVNIHCNISTAQND